MDNIDAGEGKAEKLEKGETDDATAAAAQWSGCDWEKLNHKSRINLNKYTN